MNNIAPTPTTTNNDPNSWIGEPTPMSPGPAIFSGVTALGDSTTWGYSEGVQVTNNMVKTAQDVLLSIYGISTSVVNLGTNSTAVRDLLGLSTAPLPNTNADLLTAIGSTRQIVVLNYGINEAYRASDPIYNVSQFTIDLTDAVNQLKAAGKTVIIQTPNQVKQTGPENDYWGVFRDWRAEVVNYATAAAQVAVDTEVYLDNKFNNIVWNDPNAWPAGDPTHPTESTYVILGGYLASAIYNSTAIIPVGSLVAAGEVIQAGNYNNIKDVISQILNASITGYGPTLLAATSATTNMVASYDHWAALYTDINRCIKHQTGSNIPGIMIPIRGDLIQAVFVNSLSAFADVAVANKDTVHVSQLDTIVSATTFTVGAWDSEVQNIRDYTWDSVFDANYHFNLGGYLTTTIGYNGTVASVADSSYASFVGHANSNYSTLMDPYNKALWIGPYDTTSTSYSTSTDSGVFTATITYIKNSQGVQVTSSIIPPAGIDNINLDPTSICTLYYSVDAISAPLPSIVTSRKILAYDNLSPFNFSAGTISPPQILTLRNLSGEPITISSITASSNGVIGYAVSTASELSGQFPSTVVVPVPFSIAPNDEYEVVVFYQEPVTAVSEYGTFYNSIIVVSDADRPLISIPTVQNVGFPEFDFNLVLADDSQSYTYTDWQTEYSLSNSDRILGINIANTYYLSNTDFGIIDGIRRYGLFRKPDSEGLKYWVDYTKATYSGNYQLIVDAFMRSAGVGNIDASRSRTANKFFDPGFAMQRGDFYDRTLVNTDLTSSSPKKYNYNIQPLFGSLNATLDFPGYTITLANQQFNGSPSEEATSAFSTYIDGWPGSGSILKGPTVIFTPLYVNNVGIYSTDVIVTVTATDLDGTIVTRSKTANLSINQSSLVDGNLVQWTSGFETNNAVIGMSYDRIGGKLHLTIGIGSGADGAPTLEQNGYLPTYVNAFLGIIGDEDWGTFDPGFGTIMYRSGGHAAWSNFMNTYAVWPTNPSYNGSFSYPTGVDLANSYKFYAASAGTYSVEFASDDSGYVSIDGQRIFETGGNFNGSDIRTFNISSVGYHTVTISVKNGVRDRGNPGGVAAVIRNTVGNIIWSTLDPVRSTLSYPYWPEVYRIPIEPSVVRTYQLSNHVVKNFYPTGNPASGYRRYSEYFGSPGTASAGSLITVDSDGKGNLTFNWNPQSATSGNPSEDTTLSHLLSLQYYESYFSSRKRNVNGTVAGRTTQKLVGMTTRSPRTISVPTFGYGSIEVESTVYNDNVAGITSSLKINGTTVNYAYSRGHTLAIIDPVTFVVESMTTFDTFGARVSSALTTALNNVAPGKIIAIMSFDATTLEQSTRNVLISKFGSRYNSSWGRIRVAHAFIGRANDSTFGPVEQISFALTTTFWPNGPSSDSLIPTGGTEA